MKNLLVHLSLLVGLLLINSRGIAQPGIVTTIAGGGTSTAEGAVALSASITPTYLDVDDAGNVYFKSGNYIKKYVAATNRIYTIAGNGTVGYTGDGGAATNAAIEMRDMCVDAVGNVYIADNSHAVVRKVVAATGIISTLSIPLADDPWGIANGPDGNIYIVNMMSSGGMNDVVRYNPLTGFSSTIFGSGSSWQKTSVCINIWGDIFLGSAPGNMWKRDANTGIVSSCGFGPGSISGKMDIDNAGNIYCVGGSGSGHIKKVNALGMGEFISSTTASYNNDDIDGLHISKIRTSPQDICVDRHGNLYYANGVCIRRINGSPSFTSITGNSFAFPTKKCNGVSIAIFKNAAFPATNIVTDFGDGTSIVSTVPTASAIILEHTYSATATYTIKHKLYSGASLVDSITYLHDYSFCRTISGELFFDENSDCVRNTNEHAIAIPGKIAMAINGVPVDTITIISGFSFDAYGSPGDIYTFQGLPIGDIYSICPISGLLSDTLAVIPTATRKSWAMQYGGGSYSGYDFTLYASMKAGRHLILADIIVNNLSSVTMPAILSINSSKYRDAHVNVVPSGYIDNVVYWDFAGVSALTATSPSKFISGYLDSPVGFYLPGDTTKSVCTISPISADLTPANNIVIRIDTVKASFDPNYIEVNPSGCIPKNATELTYTIGFENTGNDTAHNIYVLDTIPNSLDISSFEPLAASHEMHVYKYNLGGYYVIRFDFPNIMLPDSSHHNFCHGMFVYKIKTYGTTQSRVMVNNRVGIYFDENEVVMTNTATNEIGCPVTGIANPSNPPVAAIQNVSLFPNPTTGDLTIKTDGNSFNSCTITNAIGQQVWQQGVQKAEERVNLAHLPAGVYYVTLKGDGVSEVRKFVKW